MITKNPKNIMVADDSLFFRTKLSDILVEAGHRVRFAKDGREVIAEIKIDPGGIDLLMLDLQMPEIDGFGVLRWINENGLKGKFPVLAITGIYEPGHVLGDIKGLGAAGLMTKGYSPEQIIFRVNAILFPDKASKGAGPRDRVPVSVPVDFTVGDTKRTGFLLNISETGTFLHTKVLMLTGAVLELKFSLPGTSRVFDIKGTVRWSTDEVSSKTIFGGYGIMFLYATDGDRVALKDFVESEKKKIGLD